MAAVNILGKDVSGSSIRHVDSPQGLRCSKLNQGMTGSSQNCQRFVKNWVMPALLACFRGYSGITSALSASVQSSVNALSAGVLLDLARSALKKYLQGFTSGMGYGGIVSRVFSGELSGTPRGARLRAAARLPHGMVYVRASFVGGVSVCSEF